MGQVACAVGVSQDSVAHCAGFRMFSGILLACASESGAVLAAGAMQTDSRLDSCSFMLSYGPVAMLLYGVY